MKKWLAIVVVTVVLLAGYVAAGPFLAVRAIRAAVQEQNAAALSEHIDFAALRVSFRQQLDDYLTRRAGPEAQESVFGAIALRMASSASGSMVDMLATPAGIAAVLEGRSFLQRLNGSRSTRDGYSPAPPRDPLQGAKYGFESPSRFTATVIDGDGDPVVFVLTRQGLRWKLTDIRLAW